MAPPSPIIPNSFSSSGPGQPGFGVGVGVSFGVDFAELELPPTTFFSGAGGWGGEEPHGISLLVAAHTPGLRKVLVTPDIVQGEVLLPTHSSKKHLPSLSTRCVPASHSHLGSAGREEEEEEDDEDALEDGAAYPS